MRLAVSVTLRPFYLTEKRATCVEHVVGYAASERVVTFVFYKSTPNATIKFAFDADTSVLLLGSVLPSYSHNERENLNQLRTLKILVFFFTTLQANVDKELPVPGFISQAFRRLVRLEWTARGKAPMYKEKHEQKGKPRHKSTSADLSELWSQGYSCARQYAH